MDVAALVHDWGLWAVAVGTFLEGESVLLLAGAAAAGGHLSLSAVIAVATLASFAGDQMYYWIGHRWGALLLTRFARLALAAARMDALLARWHAPLILVIRFLYGLRMAGPIAIGMSRVAWQRFFVLNLLGAAIWAPLVAGLGYGSGHVFAHALQAVDADELWELAIIVVLGLGAWLLARWRRRRHSRATTAGS